MNDKEKDRRLWLMIYRSMFAVLKAIAQYKFGKSIELTTLEPTETDTISVALGKDEIVV